MKASKTERKKEDHLAPIEIKQDNIPDTINAEKYLSDKEVQDRLDLYSRGSQEQFFKIQKIKKCYIDKIRNEQAKRSKSDLHYAQGIRAGLPHTHYENIKDTREERDQDFRDETVKEAKVAYKDHENLTKDFSKENGNAIEVQKPANTNQKITKTYNKLGKLMSEYKAVQDVNNKLVSEIELIKAGATDIDPAESFKPDQETMKKEQKGLSRYFNKHEPTSQELRQTFKKIKGMERDI